jgi:hypothetical protein
MDWSDTTSTYEQFVYVRLTRLDIIGTTIWHPPVPIIFVIEPFGSLPRVGTNESEASEVNTLFTHHGLSSLYLTASLILLQEVGDFIAAVDESILFLQRQRNS